MVVLAVPARRKTAEAAGVRRSGDLWVDTPGVSNLCPVKKYSDSAWGTQAVMNLSCS